MSTVVSKNVQIGADGTASNNFTIYQPASPDGTLRIGNGNTGTTSAQVVLTSAGNVGIGTSSPAYVFDITGSGGSISTARVNNGFTGGSDGSQLLLGNSANFTNAYFRLNGGGNTSQAGAGSLNIGLVQSQPMAFYTANTERARIDSSGNLIVGKTAASITTVGIYNGADGLVQITRDGAEPLIVNRLTSDGTLVSFRQASTEEGNISVSGSTVSYNGGHLSRWAQTTTAKDESLVKGTVLSNLDEMNVYTDADGNPVENEQLNKVKVSDVEGDANVAGVFVNWTHDDAHDVDEINMAMTGDMIIRIAQGVTVARGDLLMSAGDGTAKPQGDDIVRSKTIAKVTSTHVTCTYADGSFCVPCVLMAC